MLKKTTLLALVLTGQSLFAQMIPFCPSLQTPSADICGAACVYCSLEGYTGTTYLYTPQSVAGWCGTIENEQWFAIAPNCDSVTITATPSNCVNSNGIQIGIYSDCSSSAIPLACNTGAYGNGHNPVSVGLRTTPGQQYLVCIDGWAGDHCDFILRMNNHNCADTIVKDLGTINICSGDSLVVCGQSYKTTGLRTIACQSASGCDSLVRFHLNVYPPVVKILPPKVLCPGDSVVVCGQTFKQSGTYTVVCKTAFGCDSTVTFSITSGAPSIVNMGTTTLCPGETITICGQVVSSAGPYQIFCPTAQCGTIHTGTIQLFDVSDLKTTALKNLCEQSQVIGCGGQVHNAPGVYIDTCYNLPKLCGQYIVQELTVVQMPILLQVATLQHPTSMNATNGMIQLIVTGGVGNLTILWFNHLQNTFIGNGPTVSGLPSGTYRVEVYDDSGCKKVATVTLSYLLDQEEVSQESRISLQPNPTSGSVQLLCADAQSPAQVQIFSIDGRLVSEINNYLFGTEIHLTGLPSGLYTLRVQRGLDGTEVFKLVYQQ